MRFAIGAGRGHIVRQFVVEGGSSPALGHRRWACSRRHVPHSGGAPLPDSDAFFRTTIGARRPSEPPALAGLTRVGPAMIGLDVTTMVVSTAASIRRPRS